jgi:predicted transcriptional regulator
MKPAGRVRCNAQLARRGLPRYHSIMGRSIKEEARQLIERLPESASWDELMEQIWIRQSMEAGIADSEAGKTTPVEQIREGYGLPE